MFKSLVGNEVTTYLNVVLKVILFIISLCGTWQYYVVIYIKSKFI